MEKTEDIDDTKPEVIEDTKTDTPSEQLTQETDTKETTQSKFIALLALTLHYWPCLIEN